jgi:hypothetical protein
MSYYAGRRVLIAPGWHAMKKLLAAQTAELAEVKAGRDALQHELASKSQTLRELQAAVLERTKAYFELRHLQRERDIVRARHAERDPAAPLQ